MKHVARQLERCERLDRVNAKIYILSTKAKFSYDFCEGHGEFWPWGWAPLTLGNPCFSVTLQAALHCVFHRLLQINSYYAQWPGQARLVWLVTYAFNSSSHMLCAVLQMLE